MIQPDEPTVERIKHLAIVGKCIKQAYSEGNQDTGGDLLVAKDSLLKFKTGIEALELDIPSKQGMLDLIDYLDKKLDRRLAGGENKY